MAKKLLYVVNEAWFFLSHRLALAQAARAAGYEVHVATPLTPEVEAIKAHGFAHHALAMRRRGVNPWRELLSIYDLWRLYGRLRPELVHHVSIKPVIYGGLAARLAGVPAVVSAVSGLGYVFIGSDCKARILRRLVLPLYRLALGHGHGRVIFQNPDDRRAFLDNGLCTEGQACLIKGSGVDLVQFSPIVRTPNAIPVVLLASRMLWDKGVGEFVKAARRLKQDGRTARFLLAGGCDHANPAAITESRLREWQAEGAVEWLGQRDDMPTLLNQADIVCLPSYREGLPRVLIEAAACAKPLVATDVPGCREIVRDGENGVLATVRDAESLAAAIARLLDDPALRRRLGERGRERVEAEYSLQHVLSATLDIYADLLGGET